MAKNKNRTKYGVLNPAYGRRDLWCGYGAEEEIRNFLKNYSFESHKLRFKMEDVSLMYDDTDWPIEIGIWADAQEYIQVLDDLKKLKLKVRFQDSQWINHEFS